MRQKLITRRLKCYRKKQKKSGSYKRLRVATIFSFAANEEQSAIGDITDESFDTSAMNSSEGIPGFSY
jgi:hypothetical protein